MPTIVHHYLFSDGPSGFPIEPIDMYEANHPNDKDERAIRKRFIDVVMEDASWSSLFIGVDAIPPGGLHPEGIKLPHDFELDGQEYPRGTPIVVGYFTTDNGEPLFRMSPGQPIWILSDD